MPRTALAPRRNRRKLEDIQVINPGRGLNNLVSDNLIDDREASELQNIWFVEAGAVSKRNGYRQVGAALSNNPRGLGTYTDSSSNKYLVTIDGTGLVYLKNTFTSGTSWTSAGGGVTFTANKVTTFTQARGNLFIWNGTEGGSYFNGTNVTRPGTMPKGKFSLFYKGYHFASGVDGQLNRLYIAESANATDFTNASGASTLNNSTEVPGATVFDDTVDAQFVDIDKDDGDKITGIATFQDSVVIFKERSIHQLTLDSTGVPSIALVTRSLGCVSHKSIDNIENDVFFLSRKGSYVLGNEPNFFNAIRTNELSSRVNPDFQLISETNYNLVSALYSGYKYFISVPEGGTSTNNVLWSYDRRFLSWSRTASMSLNAESLTTLIDASNVERLYFSASDDTYIYEITDNYSDNNSAIEAYWISKAFDAGVFDVQKRWLFVDLLFRQISGAVSITIYADDDEVAASATIPTPNSSGEMGTGSFGEYLMGGDPDTMESDTINATLNVPYRVNVRKNSRTLKIKVENNNDNENFVLLGFTLYFLPFNPFKFPSANKL